MVIVPQPSYLSPGETVTPLAGDWQGLVMPPMGSLTLSAQIANSRYGTPQQTYIDQPLHPQLTDIYEPPGTIGFVLLPFHGGGGNPRQFAASLGLLLGPATPENVNWNLLDKNNLAVWVPQGQYCGKPGQPVPNPDFNPNGVTAPQSTTFDNHAMRSGADDMQYAKDAFAAIRARYGSNVIVIAYGHSNGGMFVQRLWREHQLGWANCYFSTSGPAPSWWQTHSATAQVVKPICAVFGLLDTVLQIYPGHWQDALWYQDPAHYSLADVQIPLTWIGEPYEGFQTRIDAYNTFKGRPAETFDPNAGVVKAIHLGTQTTWSYGGGAVVLQLLSASDHAVKNMQKAKGYHLITDILAFAVSTVLK